MVKNEIDIELIWRKIHSTLSPEEEIQLQEWLDDDPAHRAYFERAKTFHSVNEEQALPNAGDWDTFKTHINSTGFGGFRWIYAIAASFILLTLAFTLFLYQPENSSQPFTHQYIEPGSDKATLVLADGQSVSLEEQSLDLLDDSVSIVSDGRTLVYEKGDEGENYQENTLLVPRGGKYKLVLSDGTIVHLNSETQLVYPVGFKDQRVVKLSGEAFFEVKEDPNRPFRVITDGPDISVLGTSFNVSSYKDASVVVTTLVEGKVRLLEGGGGVMELSPGDQSIYMKTSGDWIKHNVDTELFTGWVENVFVFEDENLESLMTTLSRWYDIDVFFVNPEARKLKFTGEIVRYEEIEKILKLIEKTHVVQFAIKGRTVIIN